ncbi:8-oxoguanine deaminase [Ornithinimicrobium sp. Y1847]|uniref:8-oxoguanine deaminase n=1 Tax=Ornithinimicrobium sp. Y1847 TaxID=3405419 RepID=UPI003B676E7D
MTPSPRHTESSGSLLWIKDPDGIHTSAPDGADASRGLVVDTEAGVITEVVGAGQEPTRYDVSLAAGGSVLLPGLVNTHHHFYQTLTRAWAPVADAELFPWLVGLYPVWARLTPQALESAVTVAVAELLLSGCTTAADHHYLFPDGLEEAVDIEVDVVRRLGSRALLTRGSMSLGEKDGGLPPQSTVQDHDTILEDSRRVVDRYHERGEDAQIRIGLAPCSPFSVTRELMRDSALLAEELDVRLHTHLAETIDEEDFCRERFGLRTVDYLESVGWLSDRTWLGHGIHLDNGEVARLGAAGTGVAHCPTSNMRLGSGTCRVLDLEEAGAPVGLGVDGSASNDGSNMIEEVRAAMNLQRLARGPANVPVRRAIDWGTRGSAAVLGWDSIGVLRPGAQADFALYRRDELRFAGSHDPVASLVLCGAHQADRVMVGGTWVVEDGAVVGLDLERVLATQREEAARLIG